MESEEAVLLAEAAGSESWPSKEGGVALHEYGCRSEVLQLTRLQGPMFRKAVCEAFVWEMGCHARSCAEELRRCIASFLLAV